MSRGDSVVVRVAHGEVRWWPNSLDCRHGRREACPACDVDRYVRAALARGEAT
jgi:hypothetical protein